VPTGLAILCPGQGSQHPELLDLAAATPEGAALLEAVAAALGWDPLARARAGAPGIFANAVAQPLVCAAELATWAALAPRLPPPAVVLGYSLGEVAAYGCAGGLDAPEAVRLAQRRAELMDAASPLAAGLVALRGLPLARVEALAAGSGAEVAIVNGPHHAVVGGSEAALRELVRRATRAGATAVRLPVDVAAHTSLLAGAVAPFAAALAASSLRAPSVPVLAGTTAEVVETRDQAIAALSAQVAARLDWERCLLAARELGCEVFLELGPGDALARMAADRVPDAQVRSVADFRSIEGVAAWVARAIAG
jgi:[acyl-carrier-protein] S-malonyltransferase